MRITILCAGKLKEKFWRDAANEYEKRLSRYIKLEVSEVDDGPDMDAEAARFLKKLEKHAGAYLITLEIGGKALSSEELSKKIEELQTFGNRELVFLIGGSDGLGEKVLSRADFRLSFSRMTFPHQLMRVILLEQIYRSYKIMANEPYHK